MESRLDFSSSLCKFKQDKAVEGAEGDGGDPQIEEGLQTPIKPKQDEKSKKEAADGLEIVKKLIDNDCNYFQTR